MSRFRSSSANNQLLISHIISKIIFIKYLPLVRPKMVPKSKMLRIYWNLAHVIFWISRSWFWFQKLFLSNIYQLPGPNWSQNQKCTEFIEIWKNRNLIKILITIIFDIKIEIGIFKIPNVPNFNKFWAFLTLRLIWG